MNEETHSSDYQRLSELRQKRGFSFWLQCILLDNGYQAVRLHRLAHWFKRHRIPGLGALVWRCSIFFTGVDINPNARIGPGLVVSHGVGLVVGGDVVIGPGCLLHHGVTLGAPTTSRIAQCPRLEAEVTVGAAAQIIGDLTIGRGALIGAGALIVDDVPAGARAVAAVAAIQSLSSAPSLAPSSVSSAGKTQSKTSEGPKP